MTLTSHVVSPAQRIVAEAAQVRADLDAQKALWANGFTRRRFLAGSGMVATACLGSQLVTTKYAYAAPASAAAPAQTNTVVSIFLRGGLDGLTAVVPRNNAYYNANRATVGVPTSTLLPLDNEFGFHPSLTALSALFQSRQLAVVHAAGMPAPNRSHFDAQNTVDRGFTGTSDPSGWLDRAVLKSGPGTTFRAVSEGWSVSASMAGPVNGVAFMGVDSLKLTTGTPAAIQALRSLYTGLNAPAEAQMTSTLAVLADAGPLQATSAVPANGAVYSADGFGVSMADVARVIKSGAGLRAATVDLGGWDVHSNAGNAGVGLMHDHLTALGQTIKAFVADLGPSIANVTVLIMSEFGRRIIENGSGGTDHGYGGVMFVLGGGVKGGVRYGGWPGCDAADLINGDLRVVNDYRNVAGEVVQKALNLGDISTIFPNFSYAPLGLMS